MPGRLPIDVKLWAIVSGVLLLILIVADAACLFDEGHASIGHLKESWLLKSTVYRILMFGLVTFFVGWAIHAVAVACGLRLKRDQIDPPRMDYLELGEAEIVPAVPWDERLAHMVALKQRGELVDRGRQGHGNR
ncbi:MAG TPA: hypothetical protein VHR66_00895 [Gemmataceae bacterium]|nr:hypothetical protein [Gemmataceae bacterium]